MNSHVNNPQLSVRGAISFYSYLKYLSNRSRKELLNYKRFIELKKIMENQSLNTFFQPILKLDSGKTIGYEVLNRPADSKLFPNTEKFYDFIGQSDQVFSFECFCRNLSLRRFIDRLTEDAHKDTSLIFLNIHPNVLLDGSYHSGETLQLLNELGIEARQVVFELTEKSAVTDFSLFEKVLSNYRAQGFRIAIDDVGSGYNSLKTLIYLKPEFVKLDRSLIQNIDQNLEQQQLVTLIIEYAKQSFTKVIAEGIETVNELKFVRENGVHYGQGYAFGKPDEEIRPGSMPQN
ncbi:MAG TPA: EAL domain-containing protein [Bacillales bacterium]|nr:EAL domain-containing protein [Bacillales bacterium]